MATLRVPPIAAKAHHLRGELGGTLRIASEVRATGGALRIGFDGAGGVAENPRSVGRSPIDTRPSSSRKASAEGMRAERSRASARRTNASSSSVTSGFFAVSEGGSSVTIFAMTADRVGVVLYEMLTGEAPFMAPTAQTSARASRSFCAVACSGAM